MAAILKCWLYANLYRLPRRGAEDGRGSSGIGSGKSIGLAEGILLPAEAVESNRSRPYILLMSATWLTVVHRLTYNACCCLKRPFGRQCSLKEGANIPICVLSIYCRAQATLNSSSFIGRHNSFTRPVQKHVVDGIADEPLNSGNIQRVPPT